MRLIWQLDSEDENVVVNVILVIERGGLLNESNGEPFHDVIRFAVKNPHMVRWSRIKEKEKATKKRLADKKEKKGNTNSSRVKLDLVLM